MNRESSGKTIEWIYRNSGFRHESGLSQIDEGFRGIGKVANNRAGTVVVFNWDPGVLKRCFRDVDKPVNKRIETVGNAGFASEAMNETARIGCADSLRQR